MQAAAHSKEPNAPPGVTKERAVPFPFGNPTELHGQIKAQYIFGTINHLLTCNSDLAGSRPPTPKILPSFRSPADPPAGLYLFGARCSRNSQLWNAFPGLREVDRAAARGLGRTDRSRKGRVQVLFGGEGCRAHDAVLSEARQHRRSRHPMQVLGD